MDNRFRHKVTSKRQKNNDWKNKIWSSNIFSVLLILLLVVSFVKVGKEVILRLEIKKAINNLELQLADLEDKTSKMDKLISYLKTDDYIEKQARLELNLSSPGEKLVTIINSNTLGSRSLDDKEPNMIKWFNYFFD